MQDLAENHFFFAKNGEEFSGRACKLVISVDDHICGTETFHVIKCILCSVTFCHVGLSFPPHSRHPFLIKKNQNVASDTPPIG